MSRFPLRAKLALVALALLVLPWAGWGAEAERELQRLTGGVIGHEEPSRDDPADAEIFAILKGLERASSRIWVVSRDYHVLALAGSLKRADPAPPSLAERLLGWLLAPPTEEFDDAIAEDAIAAGRGG